MAGRIPQLRVIGILPETQDTTQTYDEAVTLSAQLSHSESVQWTLSDTVTFGVDLDQAEYSGRFLQAVASLDIRQFGTQGADESAEKNPDTGFDSPSSWEDGVL